MRPDDIPAAHSMDTTWFAVDADGHVGMFDSGEAGAVPTRAARAQTSEGPHVTGFLVQSLAAARVLGDLVVLPRDPVALVEGCRFVVALEGSDGAFEASLGPDERVVLREHGPRLVATSAPLDAHRIALLRDDARVVGWLDEQGLDEWLGAQNDPGLFVWSKWDYGAAGRYERKRAPRSPMHERELTPELRAAVGAVRLRTHFGRETEVQLADHLPERALMTWREGDALRDDRER